MQWRLQLAQQQATLVQLTGSKALVEHTLLPVDQRLNVLMTGCESAGHIEQLVDLYLLQAANAAILPTEDAFVQTMRGRQDWRTTYRPLWSHAWMEAGRKEALLRAFRERVPKRPSEQ